MFKLFVFIILLITPSTFGLLDALYQTENECYSGCQSNYVDNLVSLNACKKGCDYKLNHENCADQCKLFSIYETIQASCVDGCSMAHPKIKQSVILIQSHPLIRLPFLHSDPIKMLNNALKELKQNSRLNEQSNELIKLLDSVKTIPLIKSLDNNTVKHTIIHQDRADRLLYFIKNIPTKSTQLISNQPKLLICILLSIIIIASIILLYKIILLCWKTPKHHNLSVRAEELIFEKEFIQPHLPIKIKIEDI